MSIRRAVAALLLSGVAMVVTATPAFAQTELDASLPREGILIAEPRQIVLSFTGHVTLPANPITVTGENGASWTIGQARAIGPVVTAPVESRGPLGPYTITYRVLDKDGTPVSGTISFTLISADAGTPAQLRPDNAAPATSSAGPHGHRLPSVLPDAAPATASTSDSGGIPAWVWIIGVVVVLAVGLFEAFRVGRTSDPEVADGVAPRADQDSSPAAADRPDDAARQDDTAPQDDPDPKDDAASRDDADRQDGSEPRDRPEGEPDDR